MIPLPMITQIYIVCAAIGSVFLVACAFMGAHHAGTGHSGHVGGGGGHTGLGHSGTGAGGHTGVGHSGAGGHTAIGHSGSAGAQGSSAGHSIGQTGHAGAGHAGAGHAGAGHGGASGGTHSGSGHSTNAGVNELIQLQASTGPFHAPTREEEKGGPVEAILSALNPTIITTFLAFFGLTGLFFISSFPILGYATLAPAFIGGFVAIKVVTTVMNAAFSRMYSSSAATEQELIGRMAEVTVPIPAGRTGEVTYIVSSKRYASPAKARSPEQEITKGTKVFICDHQPNFVLVDLWTDTFIDPAFEDDALTPQEKLAKQRQSMQ